MWGAPYSHANHARVREFRNVNLALAIDQRGSQVGFQDRLLQRIVSRKAAAEEIWRDRELESVERLPEARIEETVAYSNGRLRRVTCCSFSFPTLIDMGRECRVR